jgi:hypothetical protein
MTEIDHMAGRAPRPHWNPEENRAVSFNLNHVFIGAYMHDPKQIEPAVSSSWVPQASGAATHAAGNLPGGSDFRPWFSIFGTGSDQALGMLAYER